MKKLANVFLLFFILLLPSNGMAMLVQAKKYARPVVRKPAVKDVKQEEKVERVERPNGEESGVRKKLLSRLEQEASQSIQQEEERLVVRKAVSVRDMPTEERKAYLKRHAEFRKRLPRVTSQFSQRFEELPRKEKELADELKLKSFDFDSKHPVKWVRTKDDIVPVEMVNAYEMQALLVAKGDSKEAPIDLSHGKDAISSFELQLLSHAYDALANGTFDDYYGALLQENDEYKLNIKLGESRLQLLISAAGKVQAKTLSALLAAKWFPGEMQQYITSKTFVEPVYAYLKEQLLRASLKKNIVTKTILSFSQPVTCHAYHDNKWLIGGRDGYLYLVDEKTKKTDVLTGCDQNKSVFRVHFNTDGTRAISFSVRRDNPSMTDLILWDMKSETKLSNLQTNTIIRAAVVPSFSSDGEYVAGVDGSTIKVWSSRDGSEFSSFDAGAGLVTSVAWHPEGRFLVSTFCNQSQTNHRLIIWDIQKGTPQNLFQASSRPSLSNAVFSPKTGSALFAKIGNKIFKWNFEITDKENGEFVYGQDTFVDLKGRVLSDISILPSAHYAFFSFGDDGRSVAISCKSQRNSSLGSIILKDNTIIADLTTFFRVVNNYCLFSPDNQFFIAVDDHLCSFYSMSTADFLGWMHLSRDISRSFYFDRFKNGVLLLADSKGVYEYRLFEKNDLKGLDNMKQTLNVAQWLLLYRLYLAKQKDIVIEGSFKEEIVQSFATLPENIKEMIQSYLLPQGQGILTSIKSVIRGWWR